MDDEIRLRFSAINQWNPRVKALIDWDESVAARRAEQAGPGPLACWAVAVKDIIDVAGLPTRCNADFVPAEPAERNAVIVDQLLGQGAFVAAKAATTTFAYLDPAETRNPWNLAHTPGGSSSGSAAAVACGMVRLALGSQTVGSVNRPASFCGVVGFKPTFGRLSTEGVFPFSPTVDTVGFFAARVSDVQDAFAAVTGDPIAPAPRSLRIGVATDLRCAPAEEEMLGAVRAAADRLKRAGHDVRPVVVPQQMGQAYDDHWTLIASEVARVHRQLFSRYGRYYPAKLRDVVLEGQRVTETELREVRSRREQRAAAIEELLGSHDLLLTPSAPGPAPLGLDTTGDPRMNLLWTHTGVPSLTLPAALTRDGLPLGVQLVGHREADQALLAAGALVEEILEFSESPPETPLQS